MKKIDPELNKKVVEFFRYIDKTYFAKKYNISYNRFYRLVTGEAEMTEKYYNELKIHIDDFQKNKFPTI